jgi:hypothetical protein
MGILERLDLERTILFMYGHYFIFSFNTQPKKTGVDLRFLSHSLPGSFKNLGSHSRPVFIQKPEDRFLVPA